MFMFIKLFMELQFKKSIYKNGWKKFIIYPYHWLMYKLQILYLIRTLIEKPNPKIIFKEIIFEYANFLTNIRNMERPEEDNVNGMTPYTNSNIFIVRDKEGKISSVAFSFSEKENFNMSIQLKINERTHIMTMKIISDNKATEFSYNSIIDAKLINLKIYAEMIIRTDIAANLKYILLHDRY